MSVSISLERQDRFLSISLSVLLHMVLFFSGGGLLFQSVRYGVEAGVGGIEVDLVTGDKITEIGLNSDQKTPEEEFVVSKEVQAPTKAAEVGGGEGGAMAPWAPGYLKNPAPRYPELSRRSGEEGLVVLMVRVDRSGSPLDVRVQTGSGHPLLDSAALSAVRRWKFHPARAAGIAVESAVEVPVRFRLND